MPRDLFPYPVDRAIIREFLIGRIADVPEPKTSFLSIRGGTLSVRESTVAWFDTAGALVAYLDESVFGGIAVIHEMLDQLGLGCMRVTRVVRRHGGLLAIDTIAYFYDCQPVEAGVPFVLAGALGMAAWRVSHACTNKVKKLPAT